MNERDLFYDSSDWQLLEERRYSYGIGNAPPGTRNRIAQQFWGLRSIDDAVARRSGARSPPLPDVLSAIRVTPAPATVQRAASPAARAT